MMMKSLTKVSMEVETLSNGIRKAFRIISTTKQPMMTQRIESCLKLIKSLMIFNTSTRAPSKLNSILRYSSFLHPAVRRRPALGYQPAQLLAEIEPSFLTTSKSYS